MADARRAQHGLGDPSDGDRAAPCDQLLEELQARLHLGTRRPPVRRLRAGMSRDDVPEQDVLLEAELGEHAMDDRRRGFHWPAPRELALGGEGQAGDPGAPIAGGFADEHDRRVSAGVEVRREPLSAQRRIRVLVKGLADLRRGEPLYQRSQRTTSSSGRRRRRIAAFVLSRSGSGAG